MIRDGKINVVEQIQPARFLEPYGLLFLGRIPRPDQSPLGDTQMSEIGSSLFDVTFQVVVSTEMRPAGVVTTVQSSSSSINSTERVAI
jgi:hypothetical protein